VCLIVFTSTDNYAVLLFIYRPRKKSRQHNVRRSFVALLVCPDKKIYYVTCFLVMVFCNKWPLSILTQVFVSHFFFLQVKVVLFLAEEQTT